eukprot:Hpha_TRINITY_DN19381_c0_g1::TRINITY_DN19381_c0_g1_i1::g.81267::m.81267
MRICCCASVLVVAVSATAPPPPTVPPSGSPVPPGAAQPTLPPSSSPNPPGVAQPTLPPSLAPTSSPNPPAPPTSPPMPPVIGPNPPSVSPVGAGSSGGSAGGTASGGDHTSSGTTGGHAADAGSGSDHGGPAWKKSSGSTMNIVILSLLLVCALLAVAFYFMRHKIPGPKSNHRLDGPSFAQPDFGAEDDAWERDRARKQDGWERASDSGGQRDSRRDTRDTRVSRGLSGASPGGLRMQWSRPAAAHLLPLKPSAQRTRGLGGPGLLSPVSPGADSGPNLHPSSQESPNHHQDQGGHAGHTW